MSEESNIQAASESSHVVAKEGKHLTFALGQEDYGIEILTVREIIGMMDITPVPQVPPYVKGIINLRGKVIPVIDLRAKFGMAEIERTEETCIIVVTINDTLIGILIDKVNEVLDISATNIESAPKFGAAISMEYILGIGKMNDKMQILLNIEKVLGEDVDLADDMN